MFGIIIAVISTLHGLADGVRRGCENVQSYSRGVERKQKGIDNTNTYFDWRGVCRDLDTNEIRIVDPILNETYGQDQCIRDVYGNVVRNLSEERRMAAFEAAKAQGDRTVVLYNNKGNCPSLRKRNPSEKDFCDGPQFKDLKNNKLYVARNFKVKELKKGDKVDAGYVTFYMDFDGFLVREADSVTQKRKRGEKVPSEEEVRTFINSFNSKQGCGNGWNDCKNEMYYKDAFGVTRGMNEYIVQKYYCNENIVYSDC